MMTKINDMKVHAAHCSGGNAGEKDNVDVG